MKKKINKTEIRCHYLLWCLIFFFKNDIFSNICKWISDLCMVSILSNGDIYDTLSLFENCRRTIADISDYHNSFNGFPTNVVFVARTTDTGLATR